VNATLAATRTERAWAVLDAVPDPEVPAISVRELGIVREVLDHGASMEIVLTPTYSGCPATEVIERSVCEAIDAAGNYWALVDLPDDRYAVDLSVISAHPPCCDKEKERQDELDGIAAWLRDLVTPGGRDLPQGTPIVIAGDMNLVGGARQVRTLVAGEIADEESFGPSHPADWDGSSLADAEPRHAGGRDIYTWRDARGSFAPGKLDYIVYSDSVARLGNAFALATEELDAATLERYGLRADDTLDASDHLPVVADLTLDGARARAGSAE